MIRFLQHIGGVIVDLLEYPPAVVIPCVSLPSPRLKTAYRILLVAVVTPFLTTTVRLKIEENQLVNVFGEIGVFVDRLEGA